MKKQLKQDLKEHKTPTTRIKATLFFVLTGLGIGLVAAIYFFNVNQQPEAQALMFLAAKQESLGHVEEALLNYKKVIQSFPEENEASEALFRSARIWQYDRQDPQRALVNYLLIERDYPDSSHQRAAHQAAAQIVKYDLRDDVQAIGYYQQLVENHPEQGDSYQFEIADSYFRLENYPQARVELELLLEQYPKSDLVADVLHRKAMILMIENRLDEAKQDWLRLIELFPHGSYSSQARFNMAKVHEEQGQLEEALELYQQLEDFPRPLLLEKKINHLQQRIAARNEVN